MKLPMVFVYCWSNRTLHFHFYSELKEICSFDCRNTQCGVGACFSQYVSGNKNVTPSTTGSEIDNGCALQYWFAPGLAKYCWW